ncbi:MAG: helix-turn-helix domain-containing protein [Oscillospiraceae bacterium]|nr:helix-turn-helix domain-containing protein [Oscillospiraceae bacterium]
MAYNYVSYSDIPLIMTVEDLMPILLIGRNTAYELVRSGEIKSIRVGRQIRITRDALIEFLENTH